MSQVGSVMRPPAWKRMLSVRTALRAALVVLILLVGGVLALAQAMHAMTAANRTRGLFIAGDTPRPIAP